MLWQVSRRLGLNRKQSFHLAHEIELFCGSLAGRVGSEWIASKELARGEKAVSQNLLRGFVDLTNGRLSGRRYDGKKHLGRHGWVVEQLWTVAGDQYLGLSTGLAKGITQQSRRCRVQSQLGFLDSNQRNVAFLGPLEKSDQDTQCAEGAIRHVDRGEAPWLVGTLDKLFELNRFHVANPGMVDTLQARYNLFQILFYAGLCGVLSTSRHSIEYHRKVSAISAEQIALVGCLKRANAVRIQIVKSHP